jgi:hypothetical protein
MVDFGMVGELGAVFLFHDGLETLPFLFVALGEPFDAHLFCFVAALGIRLDQGLAREIDLRLERAAALYPGPLIVMKTTSFRKLLLSLPEVLVLNYLHSIFLLVLTPIFGADALEISVGTNGWREDSAWILSSAC